MTMQITLKPPYSKKWKKGYLVTNDKKRQFVILYNSATDRKTISYPRYLMAVKLGRELKPGEHVDHKDNDVTNNKLSNLQIMTQTENNQKEGKRRIEENRRKKK